MKALIQRVARASVEVDQQVVGDIGQGILVFLGVEKGDTLTHVDKLAHKVAGYRIFGDPAGKMNLSVRDIEGSVLVVSQFTLAAGTQKGLRPSFTESADPKTARSLYDRFVDSLVDKGLTVASGRFGADMQVSLLNDGPVTFLLSA